MIKELKISVVMTSSKLIEDFSSRDIIESWAAVRCIRSDTVADKELKIVNHDFGGLNEGIWPKNGLGQLRSDVKRSLFSSEEKSVQQRREDDIRCEEKMQEEAESKIEAG
ncbi:hypothetical protein F511_37600 [Dorcoceras hygrometricum]|uniref:Uncharacterized protein n=1 Tax=Dorcoceras hygrometricum TaxID=472368 RepID=A0A2Z7D6Y2_9LAMI|nr:hypothetical protein F511_37600 [Dorcoceras hygrometricum]